MFELICMVVARPSVLSRSLALAAAAISLNKSITQTPDPTTDRHSSCICGLYVAVLVASRRRTERCVNVTTATRHTAQCLN